VVTTMLFDRFVFVLYILFSYSWFLLGTVYDTPVRFVPIVGMCLSLMSICAVTFFQLQRLVRRDWLSESERWTTLVWSVVHLVICVLLLADGFEWVNVLIIFVMAGLFITVVIATVAICACFVIIQDSTDWCAHVHLTCICFWVLIQYMTLRLPIADLQYVTTIPVVLMTLLRVVEHLEEKWSWPAVLECVLFVVAIGLHVCLDTGLIAPPVFYWATTATVCIMIVLSHHLVELLVVIVLPFAVVGLGCYVVLWRLRGIPTRNSLTDLMHLYDEMTAEELVLTLDGSDDEDWEERL